jgi:diguanylate cyclase (GGDEF)-like protein
VHSSRTPIPLDDDARVAALHRLGVLDQPPDVDLEVLTRLAVYVSGAGASVVNLIDAHRQWQAAATGLVPTESPREDSMCAHTVAEDAVVHVPDALGDARFFDNPYVTGRLGQVRMYVGIPLHDSEGYAVGSLCVVDNRVRVLSPEQLAALCDLAGQAELVLELRRQHGALLDVLAEVDHMANHDPLTGLVNRRVLVDRLDLALSRAQRTGVPPTLFFCDVDQFKRVNDEHGHDAGDEVLVAVARHLQSLVRPHDTVARLGGDEFVVVCEDLDAAGREAVAGRLRGGVPGRHPVRLSVGAWTPPVPSTASEALRAADERMYADKQRGRSTP